MNTHFQYKSEGEGQNMNISKTWEGKTLTVALEGRLDTMSSPELSAELDQILNDADRLILDCSKLDYISSAGLRILLAAQKKMNSQGSMKVTGANEIVLEIFDVTGFSDILTIE